MVITFFLPLYWNGRVRQKVHTPFGNGAMGTGDTQ